MARIDNINNFLTDVANAIRSKSGGTLPIKAADFDTEIMNMQTGIPFGAELPEDAPVGSKFVVISPDWKRCNGFYENEYSSFTDSEEPLYEKTNVDGVDVYNIREGWIFYTGLEVSENSIKVKFLPCVEYSSGYEWLPIKITSDIKVIFVNEIDDMEEEEETVILSLDNADGTEVTTEKSVTIIQSVDKDYRKNYSYVKVVLDYHSLTKTVWNHIEFNNLIDGYDYDNALDDTVNTLGTTDTKYTVTFNTMGGNELAPLEVIYGQSLYDTDGYVEPVKAGAEFHAWCRDSEYIEYFDEYSAIREDITLYAAWQRIKELTVVQGSTTDDRLICTISKVYDFDMFPTISLWVEFKNITESEQILLTKFKMTYYSDAELQNKVGEHTMSINSEYDFYPGVKWSTSEDIISDSIRDNARYCTMEVISVESKHTEKVYTITFDTDGGTEMEPVNVFEGQWFIEVDAPEKDGYTFDGWYRDAEFTEEEEFNSLDGYSEDFTAYAKWV